MEVNGPKDETQAFIINDVDVTSFYHKNRLLDLAIATLQKFAGASRRMEKMVTPSNASRILSIPIGTPAVPFGIAPKEPSAWE